MPPKKDAKKTAPKKKTTDKKTNDKKKPLQKQKQNVNVNVTVNASGGSGGGGGKGGSSSGGGGGSKGSNKPPPAPPKDKNKELATILGTAIRASVQADRIKEYNKPPPAFTNIPSAAAPPPRAPPVAPTMPIDPDDPVPVPPAARPAARPAPARPAPIFQPIAAPRALLPPPRMIIEEPDDNEGEWWGGNQLRLEDGEVDDEYEDWEPPTRRESPILETTTLYKPPEMEKGFSHKNLTERLPKPGVVTRAMSVEMEPPRPLSLEKPPSSLMERVSKRRVITPPASPPQPMLLSAEERRVLEEEEEPQIIGGNTPVDRSPPPMPSWFRARVPPPPPAGPKPDGVDEGEGDIFKPRRGRPPKDKEDQTLTEYELVGKITNLTRMTPETFQSLPSEKLKLDDFKVDVLKRLYAIHKVDNITSKKPTKNDYILGMGKQPYVRPSQKKA